MKNKVAPPFRQAEFDILYGKGVSMEGDLLDLAVEHNIVDKSGAWYSYQGERIGQGRENVRQFLIKNPDLTGKIEKAVRKELGLTKDKEADKAEGKPEEKPKQGPGEIKSTGSGKGRQAH